MKMQFRSVIIGTAGHIDHGKTALIRALTGIDTDRLPEEKRRGITIDLGFASLETQAPDGSSLRLSFVDVPGHKDFVRNMLAGAGCVEFVMFVVSAEEGVKPQTEEHLAICKLLGIRRGITVITKSDAVEPDRLAEVAASIQRFLADSFLEAAPLITASALTGEGVPEVRRALVSLAMNAPAPNTNTVTRLPLDRAFVMKGFGTVVTGTLLSGSIREGQPLTLQPGERAVRVRGIQIHGQTERSAVAGSRTALNLSGVDVSDVHRGQMLVEPGTLAGAPILDVEMTLLPGSPVLKHRAPLHFHAFTAETMATVSLYRYEPVQPGTSRIVRLKLSEPVMMLPGDRFVLRQPSPAMTIGGGRVLDAAPLANLRKARCLIWLEGLANASLEQQLLLRIARRGTDGISMAALTSETGLLIDAIQRSTRPFILHGALRLLLPDLLVIREAIEAANVLVVETLKRSQKYLSASGLKRSELRTLTGLRVEIFDPVIHDLLSGGTVVMRGELLYPPLVAGPTADPDSRLLSAITAAYETAGLAVPSSAEVALALSVNESEMRRLMTRLLREKTLVKLGNENLFIHAIPLAKLKAQVRELRGQSIDVTRFKQLTGLSRKYAIPLLEYLDREQVTRKQGDDRRVL